MSKSTPSLMALLGLVAVAGYQNRDKLSSLLARARDHAAPSAEPGRGADEGPGRTLQASNGNPLLSAAEPLQQLPQRGIARIVFDFKQFLSPPFFSSHFRSYG